MSVIRTVFMGTPEFARYHLQELLKDDHFKIVGVVSQPDRPKGRNLHLAPSPVKELALAQNIPVITPEKVNVPEVFATLESWRAEVVVVVAFGQILPQKLLDMYPGRVVNVHASLLPRWRGAAPIQRAIMAGDKVTGVALQVMVKKLDAGDILGEREIAITDDLDALTLHDRLQVLGADLLKVELMDYIRGNLTPHAQDETQVTLAPKITKDESEIQWQRSAREIFNIMRGLALGPGAQTQRAGRRLKVLRAQPLDTSHQSSPGEVIQVDDGSFVVACGKGALQIFEVQPESRGRQSVAEYLRGHPLKVKDRLGDSK